MSTLLPQTDFCSQCNIGTKRIDESKGFPESYDLRSLLQFLTDVKSGKPKLKVPAYSHHTYDIVPEEFQVVDQPDIVIVEGLNVLQVGRPSGKQAQFVSDYFDFSIYVEAKTDVIRQWFLDRFLLFRKKAKSDKEDFFYQFVPWSESKAIDFASEVWKEVNERNLNENILPFKQRARLILSKDSDHKVQKYILGSSKAKIGTARTAGTTRDANKWTNS